MKPLLFLMLLAANWSPEATESAEDKMTVILDNHEMIVTEYVSSPGKDVCGLGMHSHNPHLSILLTDATVRLTPKDGETQIIELRAGTIFWSEAETHMAINNGDKPARVYLIENKN